MRRRRGWKKEANEPDEKRQELILWGYIIIIDLIDDMTVLSAIKYHTEKNTMYKWGRIKNKGIKSEEELINDEGKKGWDQRWKRI